MNEEIESIYDLEELLGNNPNRQFLLNTGTHDPAHIRHMTLANYSLETAPDPDSTLIIITHSWKRIKKPAPLEIRNQILRYTIAEFIPEQTKRIVICKDPKVLEGEEAYFDALKKQHKHHLVRVAGEPRIERDIEVKVYPNPKALSSTRIREALSRGDIETVRGFIAQKALDLIQEQGLYGYRKAA